MAYFLMKTGVRMLALLLAAAALSSCSGLPPGIRGGRLNATEKMMLSTYPLGTQKGLATGFVIARSDSRAPGGVAPVFVTSLHVLDTVGNGPLVIGTRLPDTGAGPQVALVRLQPQRGNELFYVRHPRYDLGAFELDIPAELAGLINVPSFLDEKAIASQRERLRAGTEVSFVGFPEVLPGTVGAFPILRSGRVASYPVETPDAQGMFLINADVYPGDSGSPVFTTRGGGRPVLAGVIVRRIGLGGSEFSHFAVAIGANAIRETLQLLADQRSRGASAAATRRKDRTR